MKYFGRGLMLFTPPALMLLGVFWLHGQSWEWSGTTVTGTQILAMAGGLILIGISLGLGLAINSTFTHPDGD